uniref:ADF-H domain-containing protein n=1 Tax=Lotharella globosa TaxID=91324 RepID=A0A7S3ZHK6_9EUKA
MASEAFAKISGKDAKAGSWMVVNLEKKKVAFVAEGEGLESLKKALDDAQCMWACINVHGVDVRANVESTRHKLVQINWVGENVPAMKKMGALQGKGAIAKLFKGAALELNCNKPEEISTTEIVGKLSAAGGAHKPTYYAFGGGEKVDLNFYDKANK